MSTEDNIPSAWWEWDSGFDTQVQIASIVKYEPVIDFLGIARRKKEAIDKLGMVVLSKKDIIRVEAAIEAKKLEDAIALNPDIIPPHILNKLRPFQIAGVLYAVSKGKCFIADEMGLGKTIQAIASVITLKAFPALVVCPASLKLNWEKEIHKWSPDSKIYMFNGTSAIDFMLGRFPKDADFAICNYELLKNYNEEIIKHGFKCVIFDESHYLKNIGAQRTKLSIKVADPVKHIFLLTGTPILNRPQELVSQLRVLRLLQIFGGEAQFQREFCVYYGNTFVRPKNLDRLNERLRSLAYIRRKKMDVLTELPPKQKDVIEVEITNRPEYEFALKDLINYLKLNKNYSDERARAAFMAAALTQVEFLKQIIARGKFDAVCEWIENFLESGEKLVVFSIHIEIQKQLMVRFPDAAHLFSADDLEERNRNVEKFQTDENCKLFIASLQAGGLGITLTAASNVVTIELGWNPAVHEQAEDRLHRIGQTDNVMAYYFLGTNTIDQDIWQLIEQKRIIVDAVHEGTDERAQMTVFSELIDRLMRR